MRSGRGDHNQGNECIRGHEGEELGEQGELSKLPGKLKAQEKESVADEMQVAFGRIPTDWRDILERSKKVNLECQKSSCLAQ